MRVLVATDAWHPQVNGVVRTYERLAQEAPKLGFEVVFLAPPLFRTLPCPTYPAIRLALAAPRASTHASTNEALLALKLDGHVSVPESSNTRVVAARGGGTLLLRRFASSP